jgi:hypothetical protein
MAADRPVRLKQAPALGWRLLIEAAALAAILLLLHLSFLS